MTVGIDESMIAFSAIVTAYTSTILCSLASPRSRRRRPEYPIPGVDYVVIRAHDVNTIQEREWKENQPKLGMPSAPGDESFVVVGDENEGEVDDGQGEESWMYVFAWAERPSLRTLRNSPATLE
ncbi:hypothetical protein S40285_10275 [Stachybotrys chlorohalonatus IBT 40285]|uniref:Uncharacterized protein n=1 Tax=Stachybotrys chlorohalonatus (strain IBT 40285) TaxID=1283841 RepID=A0A084Q9S0_STAC4|nr:hypothetical protein S40285_10275 [Stachybotrys chlorohalonata IBT 40285]